MTEVAAELQGVRLLFMQSNGGLTDAAGFRGKDSIVSGPAGGIVGMARTAADAGFDKVIGFDMGGTSTDVSHFAGEFEREYETQVAGVRMRAPMLSIHTVAAGGGSILHFDGSRYRVGPDSAGADPGPACYRRGGPLTVTDANVLLGRIQPDHFPKVFGDQRRPAARRGYYQSRNSRNSASRSPRTPATPAVPSRSRPGFIEIAVANMANAIKKISVQRGYDVTEYVLNVFGGAGGQHACAVADALGMTRVLIHPLAGVLSAYGIGLADIIAMREQAVEAPLTTEPQNACPAITGPLERDARAEVEPPRACRRSRITAAHRAHLRYQGTDTAVIVPVGPLADMTAAFEAEYSRRFSFLMPDKPVIVEAVSVEVTGPGQPDGSADDPASFGFNSPFGFNYGAAGQLRPGPDVHRRRLGRGGPVRAGRAAARARRRRPGRHHRGTGHHRGRAGLAGRGDRPRRPAAVSRDGAARPGRGRHRRRPGDAGDLQQPVHVGGRTDGRAPAVHRALGQHQGAARLLLRGLRRRRRPDRQRPAHAGAPRLHGRVHQDGDQAQPGRIRRGDVYVLNDPYHGGTHLPDITVVTPVFAPETDDIWFYVASRGHHAEIGGVTPGSMPAASTRVEEEGVLIDNWLLVQNGRLREAETVKLLSDAEYPSRDPATNLADLRAQIAANEKGIAELHKMVEHFGLDVVHAYMGHVQENAAESVRRVITALHDGEFGYELDNGAVVRVAVRVNREDRTAEIDFTGTSPQLAGNFNAPSSVAMAAVLYVFRTLVDDDIPLNSGCLQPLHVIIPPGTMLSPQYPAAVAAGNVETSQVVTGALYAALGVMAEGSGTMNNVTFGNDRYQYYETVASGSGAGDGFDGTDVVQTKMTNSRLTDPEVLEWRYPVLLESYRIRPGSGGAGRWRGGHGGVRRLRFGEPMTVTTLTGHRRVPAFGLAGGEPGALGRHWIEHPDGRVTPMDGCDSVNVQAGDVFVIETPGRRRIRTPVAQTVIAAERA